MGKSKRREIPKFSLPLIETHCHLDYLKEQDISTTLKASRAVGIETLITISVSVDNIDTAFKTARDHAGVYCSQGLHPHEAKTWSDDVKEKILFNVNNGNKEIVAIGEIGLDFYYNKSPQDKQREAFEQQMEMASKLDLPVIIHSREADHESIEVLEYYAPKLKKKGVIHSFTSGEILAERPLL